MVETKRNYARWFQMVEWKNIIDRIDTIFPSELASSVSCAVCRLIQNTRDRGLLRVMDNYTTWQDTWCWCGWFCERFKPTTIWAADKLISHSIICVLQQRGWGGGNLMTTVWNSPDNYFLWPLSRVCCCRLSDLMSSKQGVTTCNF